MSHPTEPSVPTHRPTDRALIGTIGVTLTLWAGLVAWGSAAGAFALFPLPSFAALVALLLAAAIGSYVASERLRAGTERLGLRRLTALHVWRIPAAFAFFHYGAEGLLPPLFVTLAGWGDLLAGALALLVVTLAPRSRAAYRVFHVVGLADFFVAVGTGLTFSLLADPRMGTIALFPLALIPLFGVTLSGATHVAAFDLLRRGRGLPPAAGARRDGPTRTRAAV